MLRLVFGDIDDAGTAGLDSCRHIYELVPSVSTYYSRLGAEKFHVSITTSITAQQTALIIVRKHKLACLVNMTSTPLPARLTSLSSTHKQTISLIHRLENLPTVLGQGDDARLELSAEIHLRLKEMEEQMELLRIE